MTPGPSVQRAAQRLGLGLLRASGPHATTSCSSGRRRRRSRRCICGPAPHARGDLERGDLHVADGGARLEPAGDRDDRTPSARACSASVPPGSRRRAARRSRRRPRSRRASPRSRRVARAEHGRVRVVQAAARTRRRQDRARGLVAEDRARERPPIAEPPMPATTRPPGCPTAQVRRLGLPQRVAQVLGSASTSAEQPVGSACSMLAGRGSVWGSSVCIVLKSAAAPGGRSVAPASGRRRPAVERRRPPPTVVALAEHGAAADVRAVADRAPGARIAAAHRQPRADPAPRRAPPSADDRARADRHAGPEHDERADDGARADRHAVAEQRRAAHLARACRSAADDDAAPRPSRSRTAVSHVARRGCRRFPAGSARASDVEPVGVAVGEAVAARRPTSTRPHLALDRDVAIRARSGRAQSARGRRRRR